MKFLSQPQPPTPDAFHGESGRVMADADIRPTDIVSDVIDPVRRRLAELLVGKVMDIELLGPALWPPLTAAVPEVSPPVPTSWYPLRSPVAGRPGSPRPGR